MKRIFNFKKIQNDGASAIRILLLLFCEVQRPDSCDKLKSRNEKFFIKIHFADPNEPTFSKINK